MPPDEIRVIEWLEAKSKQFATYSPALLKEVAQLLFVIPEIQGGGTFQQGQPILCKNVKSRLIYMVYSGKVSECMLMNDRKQMSRLSETLENSSV